MTSPGAVRPGGGWVVLGSKFAGHRIPQGQAILCTLWRSSWRCSMFAGKPSPPCPTEMNGHPLPPHPGSGLCRIQPGPGHSQRVCLCFLHRVFKKTSPNSKVSPRTQRRDRVPTCRLCWGSSGVTLPTGQDTGWPFLLRSGGFLLNPPRCHRGACFSK